MNKFGHSIALKSVSPWKFLTKALSSKIYEIVSPKKNPFHLKGLDLLFDSRIASSLMPHSFLHQLHPILFFLGEVHE
jgi:hypothetical protein